MNRAIQTDRSGALAQLVERLHGMQEVSGSTPLSSTIVTSEHRKVFGGTAILPHIFDPQKSPVGARLGARHSSDDRRGRRLDPNLPPR